MVDAKKEIENLKTEIAGLKIRIRRVEEYLLGIPDPDEYIHQDDSEDDLLEEAKKVVRQHDRASASLIQRRLAIGYSRAARIIDQLEEAGIIGPGTGSKPRKVIKK